MNQPQKFPKPTGSQYVYIVFLMFIAYSFINSACSQTKESLLGDEIYDAASKCQTLELAILTDPKSAEFDDYTKYHITESKPGLHGFVVTGRGKNSFNGRADFRYECVVRKVGDHWDVVRFDQW